MKGDTSPIWLSTLRDVSKLGRTLCPSPSHRDNSDRSNHTHHRPHPRKYDNQHWLSGLGSGSQGVSYHWRCDVINVWPCPGRVNYFSMEWLCIVHFIMFCPECSIAVKTCWQFIVNCYMHPLHVKTGWSLKKIIHWVLLVANLMLLPEITKFDIR